MTLPPRELAEVRWPAPGRPGMWVFVTENLSVLAAAAHLVRDTGTTVRLLCTVGTPSAVEIAAVGRGGVLRPPRPGPHGRQPEVRFKP